MTVRVVLAARLRPVWRMARAWVAHPGAGAAFDAAPWALTGGGLWALLAAAGWWQPLAPADVVPLALVAGAAGLVRLVWPAMPWSQPADGRAES